MVRDALVDAVSVRAGSAEIVAFVYPPNLLILFKGKTASRVYDIRLANIFTASKLTAVNLSGVA